MPRVTDEYLENKRRQIVDAAYNVCLRKPVEMVTISDVIAETGMSQGAIYRYYSGLDEILTDMSTKLREEYNIIDRLEAIINDHGLSIEDATYQVCDLLAEAMETHLTDIQKINFDLGVLAINEPQRAAVIQSGIKGTGNLEYLQKYAMPALIGGALSSGYELAGSPEEIAQFIYSSYTGIEKYCILSACYVTGEQKVKAEPRKLFRTLAKTILLLIGGKER
ncbi:MAG: TetR/AcrR family transcriptional regulator [Clostridiales bacterium]|nr:TetR/AcrR family transcriptional regulator [Clostridiales bacterium]